MTAGVGPGSTVYVAGAGPVGLACAAACHLLGAAVVIVGDMIPERLAQAKSFGCETDRSDEKTRRWAIRSRRSSACRKWMRPWIAWASKRAATATARATEQPATVLNSLMTGHAGGRRDRHSGTLRDGRSGRRGRELRRPATLSIRIGLGWAKSHTFATGQCPVMKYQPATDAGDSARQDASRRR